MDTQNYANHRQLVPAFHFFLLPALLLTLGGSIVNLIRAWSDHNRVYSASLILVLTVCTMLLALLSRMFALKAQDRAIRAEENLRHFALTGKLLGHVGTVDAARDMDIRIVVQFCAMWRRRSPAGRPCRR